jgi:hypothetical protein
MPRNLLFLATVHGFRVQRSGLGRSPKLDRGNPPKNAGLAISMPSTMFPTRLPRLSYTEWAYPKMSAMAGRSMAMRKPSVFPHRTFSKWRMVMRIQPLNPLTFEPVNAYCF